MKTNKLRKQRQAANKVIELKLSDLISGDVDCGVVTEALQRHSEIFVNPERLINNECDLTISQIRYLRATLYGFPGCEDTVSELDDFLMKVSAR